jgi:hypothetical protein
LLLFGAENSRASKITYLDLVLIRNKDILGLEVTVDDAFGMDVNQPSRYLVEEELDVFFSQLFRLTSNDIHKVVFANLCNDVE